MKKCGNRAARVFTPVSVKKFSCKDCEKRHVGCHATCEEYLKTKENINKALRKQIEIARKESMILDYQAKEKKKNALGVRRK